MEKQFEFITHDCKSSRLTKEAKRRVRQQAMKAVGNSWRLSGCHGRHNLIQLPPDLCNSAAIIASGDPTSNHGRVPRRQERALPPLMPWPAKEPGLDLLDISALTSTHVGAICSGIAAREPSFLVSFLRSRHWPPVPNSTHANGSTCLDDALHCLMDKVRSITTPSYIPSTDIVLQKYGRALKSLQDAIMHPETRLDPDVLCAAEVLALFELLNSSSDRPWGKHVAGAGRLIQLRGPHSFKTQYEKLLLVTLDGPIACESFLANKKCFLDDPEWMNVYESACPDEKGIPSRNEPTKLAVSLGKLMIKTPSISQRVTHVVCNQDEANPGEVESVVMDIRHLLQSLWAWRAEFDTLPALSFDAKNSILDTDRRSELIGTAFVLETIFNRLLGAVSVKERLVAEQSAQAAAQAIVRLADEMQRMHAPSAFYLAQKTKLAKATIDTAQSWMSSTCPGEVIERRIFEDWCVAMNRDVENGLSS